VVFVIGLIGAVDRLGQQGVGGTDGGIVAAATAYAPVGLGERGGGGGGGGGGCIFKTTKKLCRF
jgi:hypothetical protein